MIQGRFTIFDVSFDVFLKKSCNFFLSGNREQNGQKIPIRMLLSFLTHAPALLTRLFAFFRFEVKIFQFVHFKYLSACQISFVSR